MSAPLNPPPTRLPPVPSTNRPPAPPQRPSTSGLPPASIGSTSTPSTPGGIPLNQNQIQTQIRPTVPIQNYSQSPAQSASGSNQQGFRTPINPNTNTQQYQASSYARPLPESEEVRRANLRSREAKKYDGSGVLYNPDDARDKAKSTLKVVSNPDAPIPLDPSALQYAQLSSMRIISSLALKASRIRNHRVSSTWGRDGPSWSSIRSNISSAGVEERGEDDTPAWFADVSGTEMDPYKMYLQSNDLARQEEKARRAERVARMTRDERDRRDRDLYGVWSGVGGSSSLNGASGGGGSVAPSEVNENGNGNASVRGDVPGRAGSVDTDGGGGEGSRAGSSGPPPSKKAKTSKQQLDKEGTPASDSPSSSKAPTAKSGKKQSARDKFANKPGKFLQQQQTKELVEQMALKATNATLRLHTGMNQGKYKWMEKATAVGLVSKFDMKKKDEKKGILGSVDGDGAGQPGGDGQGEGSGRDSPAPPSVAGSKRGSGELDSSAATNANGSKRFKANDGSASITANGTHEHARPRIDPSSYPPVEPNVTSLDTKLALHRDITRGGRDRWQKREQLERLMVRMAAEAMQVDLRSRQLEEDERLRAGKTRAGKARKGLGVA